MVSNEEITFGLEDFLEKPIDCIHTHMVDVHRCMIWVSTITLVIGEMITPD